MPTLQEVIQQAKTLPVTEQVTLAEFLLEQATRDVQNTTKNSVQTDSKIFERPDMERKLEREWLKQNWREYLGQWVVIEGSVLISHGADGKEVSSQARSQGIHVPFMVRVEDPTQPQMGGW